MPLLCELSRQDTPAFNASGANVILNRRPIQAAPILPAILDRSNNPELYSFKAHSRLLEPQRSSSGANASNSNGANSGNNSNQSRLVASSGNGSSNNNRSSSNSGSASRGLHQQRSNQDLLIHSFQINMGLAVD